MLKIKEKIQKASKNKDFKRILANVFSLAILNGINVLFPLITMPYLIYVLGIGGFGVITFAIVIAQYLALISDYGFLLTATRKISIHRENKKKVNSIFWTTTFIRVSLGIISYLLFILLVFLIPKLEEDKIIYIYTFGIVLGNSLIPVWLFQGFEKMKYLTIINVITKGSFTLFVFIIIKTEADYTYVTLLQSLGYVLSGIFSMMLSIKLFKLKFMLPSLNRIIFELKDGWHIFVSMISMSFYRNSNILILGALTNDITVGYYAAAEKVIKAMQSLINPVSSAIFPYMSKQFENSELKDSIKIILNISKYYALVLLPISLIITIFASKLVYIFGEDYLHSIVDLQIMGFVLLFGGLNFLYGIIGLVNMGFKKEFTKFILISGITSILICSIFSPIYYDKAAAFALLFSEFFLLLMISIFLIRIRNINNV